MSAIKQPKFGIGTTFVPRGGRHQRPEHTVIDIHTTFDHKGEVVGVNYVSEHYLMGQRIRTTAVIETTIAMGLVEAKAPPAPLTLSRSSDA